MRKMDDDIPEGFKQTEVGMIPEEWDVMPLEKAAKDFYGGGTPSTSQPAYWGGDIHWTTSAYISGLHLTEGQKRITSRAVEESSTSLIPKDNLLIGTRVGVGKVAVNRIDVAISQDLTGAIINQNKFHVEFLAYYLLSSHPQKIFQRQTRGTTIKGIPRDDLKLIPVCCPPLPEQRAIAHVLSKIQAAAETQAKIAERARELKRALMAKLFTEGLRGESLKQTEIGLMPEGWEVVSLGDVSGFMQYGTSERCDADSSGIPVLRIPNVIGDKIDLADLKFLKTSKGTADKLRLNIGELLFVRTNGRREYVGRCAVFNGKPKETLFASYLIRIRLKPDTVLPEFVRLYTTTNKGREFLSGKASNAADGKFNINTQILRAVLLPKPSLDEQREIAHILQTVDAKIEAAECKRARLDELFRAMLGQLMTGRVRVKGLIR